MPTRTLAVWTPLPTLSLNEILARGDGTRVTVRLSRLWGPEGQVIYQGPADLVISSHQGRVVLITVREPAWAEAGPEDWNQSGLVVEDYLMEVLRDAPPDVSSRATPKATLDQTPADASQHAPAPLPTDQAPTMRVWLLRLNEYHEDGDLTVTVITDPDVWAWLHSDDDTPPRSLIAGYRREQDTNGVAVALDEDLAAMTDQQILKELTPSHTSGSYQNDKALAIAACCPAIVTLEEPDDEATERRVQAYLAEHGYQVVDTYEGLVY